jgi:hypothetical protein
MNESIPFHIQERNTILSNKSVIENLHNKSESRRKKYAPNPEDFMNTPGYSNLQIEDDIQETEKLKQIFKEQFEKNPESKERKDISDIFESIVVDHISGSWFDNKAIGHYTAEPDDIRRGVDAVVEIKPQDEEIQHSNYLGLGIDVTFSSDKADIKKKLDRIWEY